MARLIGPDEAVRVVYLTAGTNKGKAVAQGISAVIYADQALTTLADIRSTTGDIVADSQLTIDAYSRIPLFQFPDGVDTVYTSINGGPAVALYARTDDRLDSLGVRTTALEPGGSAAAVPATRQIVAGTGLTGGGALSADRTLAVSYGATAGTAAQGNDSRLPAVTPITVAAAGASLTLADAGDAALYIVTLTAASCALTFPAAVAGRSFTILPKQDGSGSRTVTWPGTVKWPMDTPPTLQTAAAAVDELSFRYDGTVWRGAYVAGYSS